MLAGLWEFPNEDKKMDAECQGMDEHMERCKTESSRKGKTYFSVMWNGTWKGKISLKTPIQSEKYVWVLKRTRKYVCICRQHLKYS